MKLTQQRLEVLKLMKEKVQEKATARTIELLYQEQYNKPPGNIYDILTNLVAEGLVLRLEENQYKLSKAGLSVFDEKKADTLINVSFTEEEIKSFQEFSKGENVLKKLAEMNNPGLMALERERLAALLVLISEDDKEGDLNRLSLLLEGEPGCGKSSILYWMQNNLWGFLADSGASASALLGSGKGFQQSEGMLEKADNSALYVDEIDKMDVQSQQSLLASLSTGKYPLNKDRVSRMVDARVRALASCNNKDRVIPPLYDRFDLHFYIKKLAPEEKENFVRKKINDWNRKKEAEASTSEMNLKRYLQYAKRFNTKLPENREYISRILVEELGGSLQGKDARRLETGIRLAIAIARIQLHPEVTNEDMKEAIKMMDKQ